MKKRGFTLIELLAVIVILAVVALIAYPVITGIIEKTKKSAALRSIEGYVEAANNASVLYGLDSNKGINVTVDKHIFISVDDTTEFSKIKAKGTLPTYSYIDFNTKTKAVKEGHFCISGYSVIYENNQAKISDTNYCEDADSSNKAEIGTEWVFDYNGVDGNNPSVQSFDVPNNGLYKLEVWGAQGGYTGVNGGQGGTSTGYKILNKDDVLYIAVGGFGTKMYNSGGGSSSGGWNGGGGAWFNGDSGKGYYYGGGGGATHIALNSDRGELANYVDNKDEILIVAGGGGGFSSPWSYAGGAGGGLIGGGGAGQNAYGNSAGGNQDGSIARIGTFGAGCRSYQTGGGGGGGWYGGGCQSYSGGGGGSGCIGGVPEITYKNTVYSPSTTAGGRTGNGYAKITLISY